MGLFIVICFGGIISVVYSVVWWQLESNWWYILHAAADNNDFNQISIFM